MSSHTCVVEDGHTYTEILHFATGAKYSTYVRTGVRYCDRGQLHLISKAKYEQVFTPAPRHIQLRYLEHLFLFQFLFQNIIGWCVKPTSRPHIN